jgi:hypothetical protein
MICRWTVRAEWPRFSPDARETTPMPHRALLTVPLLMLLVFVAGGCEAISHVTSSILPSRPVEKDPDPMIYPEEAALGEPLDVQVIRLDRRNVRFDNRTTMAMQNVTVFLNHQYGAVLAELPVGDSGAVALNQFVNHYAERYPVGSLLEPEKAQVLVLADVMIDGKVHKMSVRLAEDWNKP